MFAHTDGFLQRSLTRRLAINQHVKARWCRNYVYLPGGRGEINAEGRGAPRLHHDVPLDDGVSVFRYEDRMISRWEIRNRERSDPGKVRLPVHRDLRSRNVRAHGNAPHKW